MTNQPPPKKAETTLLQSLEAESVDACVSRHKVVFKPLYSECAQAPTRIGLCCLNKEGGEKEAISSPHLLVSLFFFFPPSLINCSQSAKAASDVFNIYDLGPRKPRLDRCR